MFNRLKELRNTLGLSQKDFATSLGLGQSTLGMMEVGKRDIVDRHIKTICALYNVNEIWFRTGKGEMFIKSSDSLINKLGKVHSLTDTELAIVQAFLDLTPENRQAVVNYIKTAAEYVNSSSAAENVNNDDLIKQRIAATNKLLSEIPEQLNASDGSKT